MEPAVSRPDELPAALTMRTPPQTSPQTPPPDIRSTHANPASEAGTDTEYDTDYEQVRKQDLDSVRREFLQWFMGKWTKHGNIDWKVQPSSEAEPEAWSELKRRVKKCMGPELVTEGSESYLHVICNSQGVFRLEQIRLLISIALELRPTSITDKSPQGDTILHIAANKDEGYHPSTRLPKGTPKSREKRGLQLVPFICSQIRNLKEAAKAVAIENDMGETCLHIAVARNIWGVTNLLDLADKDGLLKQRKPMVNVANVATGGNTALHDALHFQFYDVPVPTCETAEKKESMEVPKTSAQVSGRSPVNAQKDIKAKMEADDAGTHPNRLGEKESNSVSKVCQACQKLNIKYWRAKEWRTEILAKMIRKCPEALIVRNREGLSPYLYHVRTREAAGYPPPHETSVSRPQGSVGVGPRGDQQAVVTPTQGGGPLARTPTSTNLAQAFLGNTMTETTGKNPKGNRTAEGVVEMAVLAQEVRKSAALQQPNGPGSLTKDCEKPAKTECKFSDEVLEHLKEKAFALPGGYRDAYRCLFRDAKSGNNDRRNGKQLAQHSWQPSRRISSKTKQNYDFMTFEPMLALLYIRLTPESWMVAPKEEKDIEDMAKKDKKALVGFFNWLKGEKKVGAIVKLVMRENPMRPCSEDTVKQCLSGLEVRYLDWNKLDLSVDTLACAGNIVDLRLYSSGLNAVLCGWADTEGLVKLRKLHRITVISSPGHEPELIHETNLNLGKFKEKLERLYEVNGRDKPRIETDPPALMSGTGSGGSGSGSGGRLVEQAYHPWLTSVGKFTESLVQSIKGAEKYYTKVALIDDGVDPDFQDLGNNLHQAGWPTEPEMSFGEDGETEVLRGAWTSPGRDQHGNKMAHLITQVCPFVKLYVAKVDTETSSSSLSHPSFKVETVAQAIEWATRQDVDIISMSWNVQRNQKEDDMQKLKEAINEAADKEKGILMYGAASDNKATSTSCELYYPAAWKAVTSIGAATWDQRPKSYLSTDYKFLFPGDYVLDGDDGKPTQEGGNSAATALASGLAALVLFCLRKDNHEFNNVPSCMESLFESLVSTDKPLFVDFKRLISPPNSPDGASINPSYQLIANYSKHYFPSPTIQEGSRRTQHTKGSRKGDC